MKAFLIDSLNEKIVPIELDEQKELLPQYYSFIGNYCSCIESPYQFNDNEILLVDEEGLFNGAKKGFKYPDWHYPIVGNGIIVGVDNETGDSISTTSDVEAFSNIIWCGEAEITNHISKTLGSFEANSDLNILAKMANYELIKISNELKNAKVPKDSLAAITISKYFGIPVDAIEEYYYLAFQYSLSSELAKRLEDCMSSF
jgi:hypothetical protein